ncbi:MAG TPA: sodium:melibiose symporter [Chloroflexi bacterium]|nr:sodium:melibiose symporter [Chloroflexota bacterium]HHW87085.1 MFS transporter [Chloroflexota bacterium]
MRTLTRYITYAMGNFANTIAYQIFGNRIQFYYVDVMGLNAALAGVIWTIYGLWNAVNDPLMGQLSDRTRTPWGRRVPYVLFGAAPLGLAFFFLWTPPGQSPWVLAAYFLIILFIFDTLYSLTFIAYVALFPEVAPNQRARINLAAVREILATIALLLAFILAPILAEEVGYVWMGAIMGVLVTAGYLISMIGVREDPTKITDDPVGLLGALRIALASRPFRWFIGANIAKEYIWLVLAAMLPFWRKYALGIQADSEVFGMRLSGGDAEALLLGLPILLTIPMLLLWRPLVTRIGPRRAWIVTSLCFVPGFLAVGLANDFYSGLLGTLLVAPGLAGSMLIPFPLISEVIDDDAARHGYRREGIFFGINGGLTKLSFSAQGVLFAVVLSLAGYVAGSDVQPASAAWGVRFLIGVTPILAALLIAFCMWKYPLERR